MNFRPSASQQLLVSSARELLRRRCPPELLQEMANDPRGLPDTLWKEIAALGWPGLLVPAAQGGSDGSVMDVVLLVEEMGRAGLPGPYVESAVVATTLIRAAGRPAQQERLLPPMALGDRVTTVALLEESAAFEPDAVALRGEVGGQMTGRKLFVKDAHLAHHLIVAARDRAGLTLFVLEAARPGIRLSPMAAISGEKLFEVAFEGVALGTSDVLGSAGDGGGALASALRAGALARSAEMVGGAARVLDTCVDYARTRVQSGHPIGSFQAIQHHCADMLRDVDAARFLVYRAAWALDQAAPDAAPAVAMAKAHAGRACLAVARRGHQILGAIGYCEEHPIHLFHKRIQAGGLDWGDTGYHLETVARDIGLAAGC